MRRQQLAKNAGRIASGLGLAATRRHQGGWGTNKGASDDWGSAGAAADDGWGSTPAPARGASASPSSANFEAAEEDFGDFSTFDARSVETAGGAKGAKKATWGDDTWAEAGGDDGWGQSGDTSFPASSSSPEAGDEWGAVPPAPSSRRAPAVDPLLQQDGEFGEGGVDAGSSTTFPADGAGQDGELAAESQANGSAEAAENADDVALEKAAAEEDEKEVLPKVPFMSVTEKPVEELPPASDTPFWEGWATSFARGPPIAASRILPRTLEAVVTRAFKEPTLRKTRLLLLGTHRFTDYGQVHDTSAASNSGAMQLKILQRECRRAFVLFERDGKLEAAVNSPSNPSSAAQRRTDAMVIHTVFKAYATTFLPKARRRAVLRLVIPAILRTVSTSVVRRGLFFALEDPAALGDANVVALARRLADMIREGHPQDVIDGLRALDAITTARGSSSYIRAPPTRSSNSGKNTNDHKLRRGRSAVDPFAKSAQRIAEKVLSGIAIRLAEEKKPEKPATAAVGGPYDGTGKRAQNALDKRLRKLGCIDTDAFIRLIGYAGSYGVNADKFVAPLVEPLLVPASKVTAIAGFEQLLQAVSGTGAATAPVVQALVNRVVREGAQSPRAPFAVYRLLRLLHVHANLLSEVDLREFFSIVRGALARPEAIASVEQALDIVRSLEFFSRVYSKDSPATAGFIEIIDAIAGRIAARVVVGSVPLEEAEAIVDIGKVMRITDSTGMKRLITARNAAYMISEDCDEAAYSALLPRRATPLLGLLERANAVAEAVGANDDVSLRELRELIKDCPINVTLVALHVWLAGNEGRLHIKRRERVVEDPSTAVAPKKGRRPAPKYVIQLEDVTLAHLRGVKGTYGNAFAALVTADAAAHPPQTLNAQSTEAADLYPRTKLNSGLQMQITSAINSRISKALGEDAVKEKDPVAELFGDAAIQKANINVERVTGVLDMLAVTPVYRLRDNYGLHRVVHMAALRTRDEAVIARAAKARDNAIL